MKEFLLQTLSAFSLSAFTLTLSVLFALYYEKDVPVEEYISDFRKFVLAERSTPYQDRLPLLFIVLSAFFIPLGSLPSFFYTDYSAFAVCFLLVLSHCIRSGSVHRYFESYLLQDVLCFLVFFSFSIYAHFFGLPGKTGSFEPFTLLNLWGELPPLALVAFFIFALSFAWLMLTTVYGRGEKSSLCSAAERFVVNLIFIACFVPGHPSYHLKLTGFAVYVADALYTLLAAFAIQALLSYAEEYNENIAIKKNTAVSAVFLGVFLILISIYIY